MVTYTPTYLPPTDAATVHMLQGQRPLRSVPTLPGKLCHHLPLPPWGRQEPRMHLGCGQASTEDFQH